MRQNPPIMDYEPVTRSGSAATQSEDSGDDGSVDATFGDRPSNSEPGLVASRPLELPAKAASKVKVQNGRGKSAFLKRGHAASFVGLFLFTVVLYFRPYELFTPLSFLSNSAFWIALLTLIIYVLTQLGLEGNLTVRTREVTLLLLLTLAGLLSIPLANEPLKAWDSFTQYGKVVLMFIVMVNVVRTEKRLRALILLAMAVSCVSSVFAVNDYRLGRFVLGLHERIEGLLGNMFDNPNDLALHLATMVPIAVALLLGSKALSKKLLYLTCGLLFVAGVIATTSRGGFIGLSCAVCVLAWKLARRNRVLLAAVGFALILLVVAIAPGDFKSRMSAGNDSSAIARTDELKRSLFLMMRHPLFGLGMNNYILFSNTSHATHNAYTQVGSELGIPAMLFYIMFLITPLKLLADARRRTDISKRRGRLAYLSIGIETSLISYMVASFFLSVAYLWYAYYLVGYAIALRRLLDQPSNFSSPEAGSQREFPARSIHSPTTQATVGDSGL